MDSIIQRAKARVTLESVLKKHEVPMNYRGANPKNAYRKHSLVRIESIIKVTGSLHNVLLSSFLQHYQANEKTIVLMGLHCRGCRKLWRPLRMVVVLRKQK